MNESMDTTERGQLVLASLLSWTAELLELPRVAPEDNFLDLGGHSMLALEIVERMSRDLGAELQMEHLFNMSLAEAAASTAELATEERGDDN